MTTYATTTSVTPEESRQEIQAILRRYGATAFVYGWDSEANQSVFSFRLGSRSIRMNVPLPTLADRAVARTESGKPRPKEQAQTALDQAIRARWRATALFIKAALEAVEIGAITLDDAFLAGTLLPNNQTVKEWAGPQLDKFALDGHRPGSQDRRASGGATGGPDAGGDAPPDARRAACHVRRGGDCRRSGRAGGDGRSGNDLVTSSARG